MFEISYLLGTMAFVAVCVYYLGGLAVVLTRNPILISFSMWLLAIPAALVVVIAVFGLSLCVDLLSMVGVQAKVEDANGLLNAGMMVLGAFAAYAVYAFVDRIVPSPMTDD